MGMGDFYYCFDQKEVIVYMYRDCDPFRCYEIDAYQYDDPVGYLYLGIGTRIKPIGMIDENHLEVIDSSFWSGASKERVGYYKVMEKVSPERLEKVKADCGSVDFAAWYQEQIDSLEGYDLP